jgi:hypothetical protein
MISSGFRQMILGSAVAPFLDRVWACGFAAEIASPGYLESGPPRFCSSHHLRTWPRHRGTFEASAGVALDHRIRRANKPSMK